MKNLVLVESPSKANTINKYLGNNYTVKATVGHIKNLPKNSIGVDIKNGFEPKYETIKGKEKTVEEIKKLAKNADTVYLAPDPDREGEAIAWNIKEIIDEIKGKKPEIKRVLFHEITKDKVLDAIKNPTALNKSMYESQKARRILDRLVGYNLSPFLWEKIRRGLSAGRVQSIALYLIVEREKEINSFTKEEFWTVKALFNLQSKDKSYSAIIEGDLFKINGKEPVIKNEKEADDLKENLIKLGNYYEISDIIKKQTSRKAPLPFITSTLQQESAKILRFPVKKTMSVAQKLYEGIELGAVEGVSNKPIGPLGLITYMRTDSTRISAESEGHAKEFIINTYGSDYLSDKSGIKRKGKSSDEGKKVQDAHEAIRPTNILLTPKKIKNYLTPDEYKLYNLIWTYFTASLMNESIYDQYGLTIKGVHKEQKKDKTDEYVFKTTESILKFDGFQKVINENLKNKEYLDEENEVAQSSNEQTTEKPSSSIIKIFELLSKGDSASIKKVETLQHFTSPPPRYTEASLVKALDENGIGRPSTYQSIITNIKTKDYVIMTTESADTSKKGGSTQKFKPTELGMTVSDILKEGFSDIINLKFTANMEEKLDNIENGLLEKNDLLNDFYNKFMKSFKEAKVSIKNIKGSSEPTDIICEKCGKPMVIKMGRYGKFLSCSGYPECKNIKPIPAKHNKSKIPCPTGCGGYLVEKRTKKGRKFFGCSNYPKCDYASWTLQPEKAK